MPQPSPPAGGCPCQNRAGTPFVRPPSPRRPHGLCPAGVVRETGGTVPPAPDGGCRPQPTPGRQGDPPTVADRWTALSAGVRRPRNDRRLASHTGAGRLAPKQHWLQPATTPAAKWPPEPGASAASPTPSTAAGSLAAAAGGCPVLRTTGWHHGGRGNCHGRGLPTAGPKHPRHARLGHRPECRDNRGTGALLWTRGWSPRPGRLGDRRTRRPLQEEAGAAEHLTRGISTTRRLPVSLSLQDVLILVVIPISLTKPASPWPLTISPAVHTEKVLALAVSLAVSLAVTIAVTIAIQATPSVPLQVTDAGRSRRLRRPARP